MAVRSALGPKAALVWEAASVWLRQNFIQPLRSTPAPVRAMHYISTHRCNARCVMCGIWKETGTRVDELSPSELDAILTDPLFRALEYVGISGGEPFIRDDLAEICRVVVRRCGGVRRLSLTTNGLLTRRMRDTLPEIADAVEGAGALLDVSVSVHGMGAALDGIYGVDGAFARIEETIELLEQLRSDGRLSFSMNCVLLAANLRGAGDLRAWAAARGIPLSFVIGEHRSRFRTEGLEEAFAKGDEEQILISFLRNLADDPTQSIVAAGKYREIVEMIEGRRERSLACYYAMGGVLLGHDGRLYYCSHSEEIGSCRECPPSDIYLDPENLAYRSSALLDRECRHCPPYTRTRWEIEKDLPRVVGDYLRFRVAGSRKRP